jgi:hypothetical protein
MAVPPPGKENGVEGPSRKDTMVDTGAVRSIILADFMEALGLMSRGNRVAEYDDGRTDVVPVTEPIIFDVLGRDTLEEALVLGDAVLLG